MANSLLPATIPDAVWFFPQTFPLLFPGVLEGYLAAEQLTMAPIGFYQIIPMSGRWRRESKGVMERDRQRAGSGAGTGSHPEPAGGCAGDWR